MSRNAVYKLVCTLAKKSGIEKSLSLPPTRYSAIAAAPDATNGDVSMEPKLSCHASLDTLLITYMMTPNAILF